MKKCAICGHESPDAAPWCVRCGEASWLASKTDAAPHVSVEPAQNEGESSPEVLNHAANRPRRRRA